MNVSWFPVVIVDIVGSVLVLVIAIWCAALAHKWTSKKPDDVFRHYLFLLTLAFVFFAISRSYGHLAKQLLILTNKRFVWEQISPYSGAFNTVSFIVVFAFGIYFYRFQKVHLQLEDYKNNLEKKVALRTKELKEANLYLENVLNSSIPICITSIDHDLLRANKAYYSIWPKRPKWPKSIKCYESRRNSFCHTDDCPLQKIINGKEENLREISATIDGKKKVFIITSRPIRDAGGKLTGMVESFQDISERKKAEIDLESEREQLAVTLRSIGDGVITTDLKGKIVLINKVAEEMTGWKQNEAFGKHVQKVFNIIDERTGQPCESPVHKVLSSRKVVALASHTILIAKDGREFVIEDSGAPIFDKENKIIGIVLVFRNVTEKKRTAEELFKAKKLDSLGVLAGGIAHDFNNILAGLLGNIELAKMSLDKNSKSIPLLQEAIKASVRAKDLTQQLLTFSKGGKPVKKTLSIEKTITETTNFLLRGSSITCQFSFPDDLWLVDIDSGQISQVIHNLILNSKQAMPNGGGIKITCSNVANASAETLIDLPDIPFIKITVQDNGSGIDDEYLEKIFDPYFTTKPDGSGLGLAITHSIITKHNGYIAVRSKKNEGVTFVIYLPAADIQTSSPAQIEPEQESENFKAKILVMDDESTVQDVVTQMLEMLGNEVLIARDGKEAIEIFKEHYESGRPVDVTIMDLTIPGGMGGKDAVKEILKIDPAAKAIVSSGYSNDPVMANFHEYGFKAAIAKPFLIRDLKRTLTEVLS